MKMLNDNKGVTLVSLVITVIVLGILSAVAIISYYGDSGTTIIDESVNIIEDESRIRVKEEVLFAVMQATNLYKEIDIDKLNFLLDLKSKITTLPADIETKDGYKFYIDADGKITEK